MKCCENDPCWLNNGVMAVLTLNIAVSKDCIGQMLGWQNDFLLNDVEPFKTLPSSKDSSSKKNSSYERPIQ